MEASLFPQVTMAMFPKDKKLKKKQKNKTQKHPLPSITPCFPGSPGGSPSRACPPCGMSFKKGLRAERREIFHVYSPDRQAPGGQTAHPRILQASEGGREGCSAYPAVAPSLEMLNITGLTTTPAAGKGGTIRWWWEGDSILPHTTNSGRTSSP